MLALKGIVSYNDKNQFMPINGNSAVSGAAITTITKGTRAMDDSQYIPPGFESQDTAPKTEESYLRSALEEMQSIQNEIETLTNRLKQIKDELPQKTLEILNRAPTWQDAIDVAWEMYWNYEVTTTGIAHYFSTNVHSVRSLIGGAIITVACATCGKDVEHTFESRSAYKEAVSSRWSYKKIECAECKSLSETKDKQRHDEYAREAQMRRDHILSLKTMPYAEYLKTDHWQDLRRRMLKRAGFRCQVCNTSGQLHVHHRTYVNRGEEQYSDLIVLCATCHQEFHDKMELQK